MPCTYRCAISSTGLVVLRWSHVLLKGGPSNGLFSGVAAAGVTLLDLRHDGDELLVKPLQQDGCPPPARRLLLRWAHLVGFTRVWLPAAVVELDPATAPVGEVDITCSVCGLRLSDWSADFWQMVRTNHCFPRVCRVCGGPLLQPLTVREETSVEPDTAQLALPFDEPAAAG